VACHALPVEWPRRKCARAGNLHTSQPVHGCTRPHYSCFWLGRPGPCGCYGREVRPQQVRFFEGLVLAGLFSSIFREQGFDKVREIYRILSLFEQFDVQFWKGRKLLVSVVILVQNMLGFTQRGSTEIPNGGTFEMWIEYGRPSWQQSSSVPRGSTWVWMLPVGAKMSVCLQREPYFSPQNLPPTLPNHMVFDVN
jgi:hypothetical protein